MNTTETTAPLEFNFATVATPANTTINTIDMTISGAIGLSFAAANKSGDWVPNPKSSTKAPATVSVNLTFIDAVLANVNTTIHPAKRVIAINVNTATGGNIQLGGVNGYNSSDNHTNCTVSGQAMVCNLGAVVAAETPSNSLSVDSDPNAKSYFTGNNTSNNTFRYETNKQFIVAPNSTFDWFNATFNFKECFTIDDPYYKVRQVNCDCGKNDLTTNKKGLYFVGTDRVGMSLKSTDLTSKNGQTCTFKVRFANDNTTESWVLGTDFLNSHTVILDYDTNTITVTGGDVFAFIGAGTGSSKTVYIIVGIAVAVAAIAIAIVIYCCCCKKNEGDDYREQK
jgi:uncharacterized membrane protein YuzA (DUF378 family)